MHLVCVVRNFLYLSKHLSNALITKHLAKGHLSGCKTYPFALQKVSFQGAIRILSQIHCPMAAN